MPLKIIYLDDEADLLELFVDFFSGPGIEIQTFQDWKAALAEISKNPPDLFFIDYRLGGTTGDEVAKLVSRAIPKVLLTGELAPELKQCFEAVFAKPFDVKRIGEFIGKHQKQSAA